MRSPSRWISSFDRRRARVGDVARQDDGARQAQRVVVDLGLRQVERVGALDRARREVVGRQVADHLATGVDDQRQLGLGDVPGRVGADSQRRARCPHARGGRLEEELGPLRLVDQLVDVAHRGLLDACRGRAPVGDAAGPHLLIVDGRQQLGRGRQRSALQRAVDRLVQALAAGAQQLGQRAVDRVQVSPARDGEDGRAVDQHAAQPLAPGVGVSVERGPGHGSESIARRNARDASAERSRRGRDLGAQDVFLKREADAGVSLGADGDARRRRARGRRAGHRAARRRRRARGRTRRPRLRREPERATGLRDAARRAPARGARRARPSAPSQALMRSSGADRAVDAGVAADGSGVIVVQRARGASVPRGRVRRRAGGSAGRWRCRRRAPARTSRRRRSRPAARRSSSGSATAARRWRLEAATREPGRARFGAPGRSRRFVRRPCCTSVSVAIGARGDAAATWTLDLAPRGVGRAARRRAAFRAPRRLASDASDAPRVVVGDGGTVALTYSTQHVPLRAADGLQLRRAPAAARSARPSTSTPAAG